MPTTPHAVTMLSDTASPLPTADREALHDLVVEHSWLLDHGRWHEVADLYLADATLSIGPKVLHGRAEMLAWADHRATNTSRHTRHQCSNIRLRPDGVGGATGTVMLVLYVSDNGAAAVEFVGEYRDRYRRQDGQWRFLSRALHPMVVPATAPPGGRDA